jgi:decaprenyl-phosphate phosphoribosyltransferase
MLDVLRNIIIACRPKHWIKNLLVFALPFSDGLIIGTSFDPGALTRGFIVFCSLSAMSSANYIFNDIHDLDHDKQHAKKKMRPFAAEHLSIGFGLLLATGLASLSLALSLLVGNGVWQFVLLFGFLQLVYTLILKQLSGYDLVSLSLLYVFRAIIPASYEQIGLSKWFLVIFFAGALFLATGKRYSEIRYSGVSITRKSLSSYNELQLALWVGVSLSLFITSYLSWIFTFADDSSFLILLASFFPMTVILIRVSSLTLSEHGEDPTKAIFRQKDNFLLVAIWLTFYLVGKNYL